MKVNVYTQDAEDNVTYQKTCDLRDCFQDDTDYETARMALVSNGHYKAKGYFYDLPSPEAS